MTGAQEELDLDGTIKQDGASQGYIDIVIAAGAAQCGEGADVPRHRRLDGSAYQDVRGAVFRARTEFKHLEFFYFHNCLYEQVWKDNRRRNTEKLNTWDVLHKFPHDYKVLFVGDAT